MVSDYHESLIAAQMNKKCSYKSQVNQIEVRTYYELQFDSIYGDLGSFGPFLSFACL